MPTNPNAAFQNNVQAPATQTTQGPTAQSYQSLGMVPPQPPASPITPDLLNSTPKPLQTQQPSPTPLFDVSSLTSQLQGTYQPTQQEQQQSDLSTRLQQLNEQLAGKTSYETDLAKSQGLAMTTDANGNPTYSDPALLDLNAKLNALTNEAKAIPLQAQNAVAGRAVTTAGLDPITTARLRNNSIQALQVSSLIAAKNAQLNTAKLYIDQAVTQKYGPVQAEIDALQKNLQLIQNDPNTKLQDQRRAAQQQELLAQRTAALDAEKTNYTNAQQEVLKYASIAPPAVLQQMQQAATPAQVAQIASTYGYLQPQTGRYKDSVTTTTDMFGNQHQTVRVFDTLLGKFVDAAPGTTADHLNNSPAGIPQGTTQPQNSPTLMGNNSASSAVSAVNEHGVTFEQYGLLSRTDYNPSNAIDQTAARYLDTYLKKGTTLSARDIGGSIKAGGMAALDSRARDLYFQATGQSLPNPEIIKGYQQQLIGNNKLLNNLNVQEGTIGKNAQLLLNNLNANNLNQNIPSINGIIDQTKNMLGDPNVAQFLAQNATVSNELGSLLALKNAQGTTVHDKLEAAGIISANDTSAQIASKVKILLQEAVNARSALSDANKELYQQVDPLMQDSNNPMRDQARHQPFIEHALNQQNLDYNTLITQMQQELQNNPAKYSAENIPALDATTGKPAFASQAEIKAGKFIPL